VSGVQASAPEPPPVTLPGFAVARLRELLDQVTDWENTTPDQRMDARIELCGYLSAYLRDDR
jgi:hypothetical protein